MLNTRARMVGRSNVLPLALPKRRYGKRQTGFLVDSVASLHHSQRNTFAESAVQIANTTANAATSPMCADHASPFQIPGAATPRRSAAAPVPRLARQAAPVHQQVAFRPSEPFSHFARRQHTLSSIKIGGTDCGCATQL